MTSDTLLVNRAPVLTLWATIVAERLGHPRATALTLGKALAGLNAQSKGRRLGIFEKPEARSPAQKQKAAKREAASTVPLLGRGIPVVTTAVGVRARVKDAAENPATVERYLAQKFGAALAEVEAAMRSLARTYPPKQLNEIGFELYERFRPTIPDGVKGWGAKGRLDLEAIRSAGRKASR